MKSGGKCENKEKKKCLYKHPPFCGFFLNGKCRKGKDCDHLHYNPTSGEGKKPTWDKSKGKPPGYKPRGGSARAVVDSPRRHSDKEKRYADKNAAKQQKRKTEFKAKKRSDKGKLRDKKHYSAKIAMYTALAAIAGDAAYVPPLSLTNLK